jgi:RNA polymerase sigma factor (sigma-70 family)
METEIELVVLRAQQGQREALEAVVSYAQRPIYNLALRMLGNPSDAEDATQEILIKLITHLSQFRGESRFSTWMYRVASTTLLNLRERNPARQQVSFEALAERMDWSLAQYAASTELQYEQRELITEVRRSCTLGILLCLSREDRLALILGEILELSGPEAATIMEVSVVAYRKRLSRARQALVGFVSQRCGIVNPASPCRCQKHIPAKQAIGQLDPQQLQYAPHTDHRSQIALAQAEHPELDQVQRSLALLRAHPIYPNAANHQLIQQILAAGMPPSA